MGLWRQHGTLFPTHFVWPFPVLHFCGVSETFEVGCWALLELFSFTDNCYLLFCVGRWSWGSPFHHLGMIIWFYFSWRNVTKSSYLTVFICTNSERHRLRYLSPERICVIFFQAFWNTSDPEAFQFNLLNWISMDCANDVIQILNLCMDRLMVTTFQREFFFTSSQFSCHLDWQVFLPLGLFSREECF